MTGLLRILWQASSICLRAASLSALASSISRYLPTCTAPTPVYPMCARAFCTDLPCGSSTAFFGVITIFAFIIERDSQLLVRQNVGGAEGPRLEDSWPSQSLEATTFFAVSLPYPAHHCAAFHHGRHKYTVTNQSASAGSTAAAAANVAPNSTLV